jgi:peptidyl-prolyl cis-trans isomerase SurA
MIRNSLFLLATLCMMTVTYAQKHTKTVLKIGDKSFSVQEFNYIFNKNNPGSLNPMTKQEYLDLFVNYKLKVADAEAMGLDTIPSFISELDFYRNELAKPYLTDRKAEDEVIAEAYERLKYDINASHILVMVRQDASPQDTLKAWEKITKAQQEIVNGASFEETAKRYSEDPSVKNNSGRLGWFTAFQMVYPFETAAYKTQTNQLSPIVRTAYGYHLIKVNGKRPSSGEILVAHIMKTYPQNATQQQIDAAKESIDSIYIKVKGGDDFATIASLYSDDRQSAESGGELPWFSRGRMIEAFSDQAFALANNGDISEPFRTQFGWHIAKRLDYKPIGTIDDEREGILERLTYDERSQAGVKTLLSKLKKEYSFKMDTILLNRLTGIISSSANDSAVMAETAHLDGTLYSFTNKTMGIAEFIQVLKESGMLNKRADVPTIAKMAAQTADNEILNFEKSRLEEKYPEFKFLMQEYHDGLLVFEISQKKIWSKASSDTTEIKNFYNNNIHRYSQPQSFSGKIIKFDSEKRATQFTKKLENNNKTEKLLKSCKNCKIIEGSFIKGEDAEIDAMLWPATGTNKLITGIGNYNFGTPIDFDTIKGTVISDYQDYLEKQWITDLHNKYRPKIYPQTIK